MGTVARRRRPRSMIVLLLAIIVSSTGCSWGSNGSRAEAGGEPATLRVAVTKAMDTVPLRLAVAQGIFAHGGLRIDLVEAPNQRRAFEALKTGAADVAFGNNVALFRAAASGSALQLQGEAYISGPNTMALVTLTDVGYEDPSGKQNPVIAVPPDDELGGLTTRSRLATEGIDSGRITFRRMPFDAMMNALRDHDIDAAWLTEPAISQAQKEYGARIVADTGRGAMLNFPMSSYAARRDLVTKNPATFAVFRRLLGDAQRLGSDPSVVRAALPDQAGLDATTSALVALGTYPTSLSSVRLQRVADLMHDSGVLDERLDVRSMMPEDAAEGP